MSFDAPTTSCQVPGPATDVQSMNCVSEPDRSIRARVSSRTPTAVTVPICEMQGLQSKIAPARETQSTEMELSSKKSTNARHKPKYKSVPSPRTAKIPVQAESPRTPARSAPRATRAAEALNGLALAVAQAEECANLKVAPVDTISEQDDQTPSPLTRRKRDGTERLPDHKRRELSFNKTRGILEQVLDINKTAEEYPPSIASGAVGFVAESEDLPVRCGPFESPKEESTPSKAAPTAPSARALGRPSKSSSVQFWERAELDRALAGIPKESVGGPRILKKSDVLKWLDSPAAARIHALQLAEGVRKTAALVTEEQEPLLQNFLDRVVFEADLCHPPFSGLRDAEPDEVTELPRIAAEFASHLAGIPTVGDKTREVYVQSFLRAFELDGKAPEEMASLAYGEAVRHTYEDVVHNHIMSASLRKFAVFWQECGGRPFIHDTEAPPLKQATPQPRAAARREAQEGDGSAEARAAEGLPEGWCVHRTSSRVLAWTTPRGEWLIRKPELMRRLRPPAAPALQFVPAPPPVKLPLVAAVKTGELPSLMSLLQPMPKAGEQGAAAKRDRDLLPQVIATFVRVAPDNGGACQATRLAHASCLFRIFAESQRSLEAMAQTSFADIVARSAENKRNQNMFVFALLSFRAFWLQHGGYEAELDDADGESLQSSLQVVPMMTETDEECSVCNDSKDDLFRQLKRKCETCSTVLCCEKHEEHSTQACKSVFWTKYQTDGTRVRTMADFFGKKAVRHVSGGHMAQPACVSINAD